jgi:hypothetical protein
VPEPTGRIVATERNIPARHVYRDHGFTDRGQGTWMLPEVAARPVANLEPVTA